MFLIDFLLLFSLLVMFQRRTVSFASLYVNSVAHSCSIIGSHDCSPYDIKKMNVDSTIRFQQVHRRTAPLQRHAWSYTPARALLFIFFCFFSRHVLFILHIYMHTQASRECHKLVGVFFFPFVCSVQTRLQFAFELYVISRARKVFNIFAVNVVTA